MSACFIKRGESANRGEAGESGAEDPHVSEVAWSGLLSALVLDGLAEDSSFTLFFFLSDLPDFLFIRAAKIPLFFSPSDEVVGVTPLGSLPFAFFLSSFPATWLGFSCSPSSLISASVSLSIDLEMGVRSTWYNLWAPRRKSTLQLFV